MSADIKSAISILKKVRLNLPAKQALPDDNLLDIYQKDMGVRFPEDYRTFLKEASDSIFGGKDALMVTSARSHPRELIVTAKEAWSIGVPRTWIPICEDNGNYYCVLDSGEVRYWSHDGISMESWPTVGDWIKNVWIERK